MNTIDLDALTVNLMLIAGLDKHKARECADVVNLMLSVPKMKFKCVDCGHEQMVSVAYDEDGSRYFGSGANWCDMCKTGLPVIVEDNIQQLTETNDSCTALYKAANNEHTKPQPITTKRVFAAMRHVEYEVRKHIEKKL